MEMEVRLANKSKGNKRKEKSVRETKERIKEGLPLIGAIVILLVAISMKD